jgi:hypothetical protein
VFDLNGHREDYVTCGERHTKPARSHSELPTSAAPPEMTSYLLAFRRGEHPIHMGSKKILVSLTVHTFTEPQHN